MRAPFASKVLSPIALVAAPLTTLLAGAVACGSAFAAPLPPPPYAADQSFYPQPQGGQAAALPGGEAPALDRYGGGASHPVPRQPAPQYAFAVPGQAFGPAPAQAPQRTLGWSGKTIRMASAAPPALPPSGWTQTPVQAAPQPPVQGWSRPAPQPLAAAYAPPPIQTARVQAALVQAAPAEAPVQAASGEDAWRGMPPPVRSTIYDPPQPAAPRQPAYAQAAYAQPAYARAQPNPNGPRFYSLHRDYGIQPDAIPIPPQFFGPTADLSAPPNDPVVKRVTNAAGQSRTVAVGGDDASAQ